MASSSVQIETKFLWNANAQSYHHINLCGT